MVLSPEALHLGIRRRASGTSTETFDVGAQLGSQPCDDVDIAASVLELPHVIRERRWRSDADVLRVIWHRPGSLGTVISSESSTSVAASGEEESWTPIRGLLTSVLREVFPQGSISAGVADALRRQDEPSTESTSDVIVPPTWSAPGSYRMTVSTVRPSSTWLAEARRKVRELLALPAGWDLYSARQITGHAGARAFQLLENAAHTECPAPSIVPMSHGGIQVEWHIRNMNIEVTIPPEGSPVEVWYEDLTDRSEHEFALGDDGGPLRLVLTTLAQRR